MNAVRFDPPGPFKRDPLQPHQMRDHLTRAQDVFCALPPRCTAVRTRSMVANDRRYGPTPALSAVRRLVTLSKNRGVECTSMLINDTSILIHVYAHPSVS